MNSSCFRNESEPWKLRTLLGLARNSCSAISSARRRAEEFAEGCSPFRMPPTHGRSHHLRRSLQELRASRASLIQPSAAQLAAGRLLGAFGLPGHPVELRATGRQRPAVMAEPKVEEPASDAAIGLDGNVSDEGGVEAQPAAGVALLKLGSENGRGW